MAYYDLREYLKCLKKRGKLRSVKKEVDKDWEISAVCRQIFYKFSPKDRPALLFENVKGFQIPVAAGTAAASPEIYQIGMEADSLEEVDKKWDYALRNLIPPITAGRAPCKENIMLGNNVDLSMFPIPIWTAGQDAGPYITSALVITKDPITKVHNVGTYRMMVKGKNKTGLHIGNAQDAARHIEWYEKRQKPAPVAVALGTDPTLCYVSTTRTPDNIDEFALAGGLRKQPVELVKCETIPLEVPASAEIILEGEVPFGVKELEGPFGEYTGYMSPQGMRRIFNIKCITFRNNPIFHAFISQMPPSESSCIRKIGNERIIRKFLKNVLCLPITDVYLKESGGSDAIMVVGLKKQYPGQVKQLIHGLWAMKVGVAKIVIVVDDDIDVHNDFEVERAMSFRARPDKDVYIERDERAIVYDPSLTEAEADQLDPRRATGGRMAIDATWKFSHPESSLPPKEHLEIVKKRWYKYGI